MRFVVTLPSPTLEQLAEVIGLLRDIKEAYGIRIDVLEDPPTVEENVPKPEEVIEL